MADIEAGRSTADLSTAADAEVVVFLMGMRINRPWKVSKWWPVFTAMPRMLRHLEASPDRGLLAYRQAVLPAPLSVQYWRSFEDLERFARDKDDPHLEPWRRFNRTVGASGDVGIWHETYRVRPRTSRRSTATCRHSVWGLPSVQSRCSAGETRRQRASGHGGADAPALPPY